MEFDPTLRPFFLPPNWSAEVMERLQFRTDVIPSANYKSQTRATRLTPRRSFEYQLGAGDELRQRFANAAYLRGGGAWYLPLWIDGVETSAAVGAGSDTVPAAASGRPFEVGGAGFIQSPDGETFELAQIGALGPSSTTLAGSLAHSYPPGSKFVPAVRARIDRHFSQSAFSHAFAYGRVKFDVLEPNPFPAHEWETIYRGYPVLVDRPLTNRDPEQLLEWMLDGFDDDIAIPVYRDPVGVPLYRQTHDWVLATRPELDRFRGIAYALEGKQKSLWVPTWSSDLTVHQTLSAGQTALQVRRCGAAAVAGMPNRRDLRIETTAGVYYRRIASASDTGSGQHETLTLDAPLPVSLSASNVVQISYMALARSESDNFEIRYFTGEAAEVATSWRARNHDV